MRKAHPTPAAPLPATGAARLRHAGIALMLVAALGGLLPLTATAQTDEPWVANLVVPETVRRFLLALDTAESGIPYKVRERMLHGFESIDVSTRDAAPERYMRASVEGFTVTIRTITTGSLEGPGARQTVYLLWSGVDLADCAGLKPWLGPQDRVGRRFCEDDAQWGYPRIRAKGATRFGVAAYRYDGGRPKNITRKVFPEDPVARLPAHERAGVHDEAGVASHARVDLSRLSEVPVMRLYLEYGDGHGLPRSHPRAFSGGYPGERVQTAHFGFLVWNGQRFELRQKVPRALWPCTYDESFSPSGRSCDDKDPDPFIQIAPPPAS